MGGWLTGTCGCGFACAGGAVAVAGDCGAACDVVASGVDVVVVAATCELSATGFITLVDGIWFGKADGCDDDVICD